MNKEKLLKHFMKGYYFITDAGLSRRGIVHDVRQAISAGVKFIQYRNKEASTSCLYREALILKRLCKEKSGLSQTSSTTGGLSPIFLIINDRVDIALAVNADGVHLGQDDMPLETARRLLGPKRIIGVTVHNAKEALNAKILGADYLGVSPIFSTKTKSDAGMPKGLELIKIIRSITKLPIVAIGGITLDNAREVFESGADCVCAISAVVTKINVSLEIDKFNALCPLAR